MWNKDAGVEAQPIVGGQLSDGQQKQLQGLLQEFTDVMKNEPGCTTLTEHRIETKDARQIRQMPY